MRLPQQEHWRRLPPPSPRDLPNPGIKISSPALAGFFFFFFFNHLATREAHMHINAHTYVANVLEWILNALIITVILEQVGLEKSSQGRFSLIISFYFYKKNVFIYYHAINFVKRLQIKTELTLKTTLSLFPILLPKQHQPSTPLCVSTQPDPGWRPGRTKLRPSASQ